MPESLRVDRDGAVATVTLDRPDQMNGWDWVMHRELGRAYAELDADDGIRAIVLTGAGRAFCAGALLAGGGGTFDGRRHDPAVADDGSGRPLLGAEQTVTPVIAAVNGAAVGAGITMALACDIRIVAETAKLGFVFTRRGMVADGDLLWSLPRTIGYAAAMELLLTGRIFDGAEAARLGLATRAVPVDDVLPTARAIAADIAENTAPVAVAITKHLARQLREEPDREAARRRQWELFRWIGTTPDAKEGVDAFLERRPPVWTMSATDDLPEALGLRRPS